MKKTHLIIFAAILGMINYASNQNALITRAADYSDSADVWLDLGKNDIGYMYLQNDYNVETKKISDRYTVLGFNSNANKNVTDVSWVHAEIHYKVAGCDGHACSIYDKYYDEVQDITVSEHISKNDLTKVSFTSGSVWYWDFSIDFLDEMNGLFDVHYPNYYFYNYDSVDLASYQKSYTLYNVPLNNGIGGASAFEGAYKSITRDYGYNENGSFVKNAYTFRLPSLGKISNLETFYSTLRNFDAANGTKYIDSVFSYYINSKASDSGKYRNFSDNPLSKYEYYLIIPEQHAYYENIVAIDGTCEVKVTDPITGEESTEEKSISSGLIDEEGNLIEPEVLPTAGPNGRNAYSKTISKLDDDYENYIYYFYDIRPFLFRIEGNEINTSSEPIYIYVGNAVEQTTEEFISSAALILPFSSNNLLNLSFDMIGNKSVYIYFPDDAYGSFTFYYEASDDPLVSRMNLIDESGNHAPGISTPIRESSPSWVTYLLISFAFIFGLIVIYYLLKFALIIKQFFRTRK